MTADATDKAPIPRPRASVPGTLSCPLCGGQRNQWWHQRKQRDYWRCQDCQLVFVCSNQQLSAVEEKAEYDRHQNEIYDPGYRRFLTRPWQSVCDRVPAGSHGLDFGCGPGPALATMLKEAGYCVALYDWFYYSDQAALARRYAFICMTEVIEHLVSPSLILTDLWALLEEDGWLVIQTQRVRDREAFVRWRYVDDPTHIAFYSEATFVWRGFRLKAPLNHLTSKQLCLVSKQRRCAARMYKEYLVIGAKGAVVVLIEQAMHGFAGVNRIQQ